MKNISDGFGSDYIVRESATGRLCTCTLVIELMQDKVAPIILNALNGVLEPSTEKTELQDVITRVNEHWKKAEEAKNE